jgi:hypothetical protein
MDMDTLLVTCPSTRPHTGVLLLSAVVVGGLGACVVPAVAIKGCETQAGELWGLGAGQMWVTAEQRWGRNAAMDMATWLVTCPATRPHTGVLFPLHACCVSVCSRGAGVQG